MNPLPPSPASPSALRLGSVLAATTAYPELASVSAIVAATLVVVQVLKKLLSKTPAAKRVPTWCYAIAVDLLLTVLAKYGLHALEGDVGPLLWQGVLGAAAAGGFQTWIQKPAKSPKDHAPLPVKPVRGGVGRGVNGGPLPLILLMLGAAGLAAGVTGCATPQYENEAAKVATQVANEATALTFAIRTVNVLHEANVIGDKALIRLDPIVKQMRGTMVAASNHVDRGQVEEAKLEMSLFSQLQHQLDVIIDNAKKRAPPTVALPGPSENPASSAVDSPEPSPETPNHRTRPPPPLPGE